MKRGFFKFGTIALLLTASVLDSQPAGKGSGAVFRKASPRLRERLIEFHAAKATQKSSRRAKDDTLDVFIQTRNPLGLKKYGVQLGAILGGQATAAVPVSSLDTLLADPDVTRIELGVRCRPSLDVSIPSIGVDKIRAGIDGMVYTGKGVIVGIYDTGIDWAHGDFINPDGTSRILYLWDQTYNGGPHPSGFDYGTEYVQSQINGDLSGLTNGTVRVKDVTGHGTHVAGIVCGNGRGTGNGKPGGVYVGVAPEAELIVVKGPDDDFLTNKKIVDGVDYIFSKADLLKKPAVVNLSENAQTQEGPHDGTSLFEQDIDLMLGNKGRAVVVAAGNDGDKAIHFGKEFSISENSASVSFRIGSNAVSITDYVLFDIWYWPAAGLSVSIVSPGGRIFGPVPSGVQARTWESTEGFIKVDNASEGPHAENGDMEIQIQLSDSSFVGSMADNLATGIWRLDLYGYPGRFDGWLAESSMNAELTDGADFSSLIAEPGNARLCITVGSYVSRDEWPSLWSSHYGPGGLTVGDISSFSSPGPPRTNSANSGSLNKPELAAPGEYILSSFSKNTSNRPDDWDIAPDSVHCALKGTSMAAPHVTGTIALLFQANPDLNASEIKNILSSTAVKVQQMGGLPWEKRWGYGKLDAFSAMLKTPVEQKNLPSIPDNVVLLQNYPNPFNASTVIRLNLPVSFWSRPSDASLDILDLHGRPVSLVYEGKLEGGWHQFFWDGRDDLKRPVPSGVYLCRFKSAGFSSIRKFTCLR